MRLIQWTCVVIMTVLVVATTSAPSHAGDSVVLWWEAEQPTATNFPKRHWFMPANEEQADKLSAGNWLGVGKKRSSSLYAIYQINVPESGEYNFWVRKFWKHGPFRWRFDQQDWQTCGKDINLVDSVTLRTHVVANWVSLGKVDLEAGRRKLTIQLLENEGAAAFDCFVLTSGTFTPRGKMKPGEKHGSAPDGWFAFEPDTDPFTDEALIDLRMLNQPRAGADGFIQADGPDFVFADTGQPVRFWAVNVGPWFDDRGQVDYLARRLAKLGVNMIRIHSAIFDGQADDPAAINRDKLDKIHYAVKAFADQGIYTKLSFYFPLWMDGRRVHEDYTRIENNKPFALLFFDSRMQEIYKAWARGLLTTVNPYTGKSLADDPALGMVEIINEDNYFFWTFKPYETLPAGPTRQLERLFGTWAVGQYGSIGAALEAWDGRAVNGDDPAGGRLGLYPVYHLTSAANAPANRRACDQARFLTEQLRQFYVDMRQHFREALGVKCPITATNWKTADDRLLGPLDKYTNLACDVIDRHAYFGGEHEGEGASYSVRTGHRYIDRSALFDPTSQPVHELQYGSKPHIVSEFNWPMPNRFRSEYPLLSATYGSLQGTDGFFHFAIGSPEWNLVHHKFSVYTPEVAGQFPAASLIFRRRYVEQGPVVVRNVLNLPDLYALKGSPIRQPQNLDALRAADIPEAGRGMVDQPGSIDPLAFFVGQVVTEIHDEPARSMVQDLSPFIDRQRKTIRSATGQLTWDYQQGMVTVNSPTAQGVFGFIGEGWPHRTADLTIDGPLPEYGAILVVSVDGKPLTESSQTLVQVMTEDRNTGWETRGQQRKQIVQTGGPPMIVRQPTGRVTLRRSDAAALKTWALDLNLYPKQQIDAAADDAIGFDLRPDRLYYAIVK